MARHDQVQYREKERGRKDRPITGNIPHIFDHSSVKWSRSTLIANPLKELKTDLDRFRLTEKNVTYAK